MVFGWEKRKVNELKKKKKICLIEEKIERMNNVIYKKLHQIKKN